MPRRRGLEPLRQSGGEPGPMALVHAAVRPGLAFPSRAGLGSRVSGMSQAMDNGTNLLIVAKVGRNVCTSPDFSVPSDVVPTTSTRSGRTAKASGRLIAVGGMVRVNTAMAPGARVLPTEVVA